jgi:predicted O-methyltransferase YrrM
MAFKAGHYHSPLPSSLDIARYRASGPAPFKELEGLDLDLDKQVATLRAMAGCYQDQPFSAKPGEGRRYRSANEWFPLADAIALHCLIHWMQPRKIVEIGCGWSTAAMLDSIDTLRHKPTITLVEPNPERLQSVVGPSDLSLVNFLPARAQDIPLELFGELDRNDLLFVDSTHVSKLGSDVNRLVLEVLPSLRPGVCIHFHDVFWPFDYPVEWLEAGRAWNEAYLLHAFLIHNDRFEILLFLDALKRFRTETLRSEFPLIASHDAASVWLRRIDGQAAAR